MAPPNHHDPQIQFQFQSQSQSRPLTPPPKPNPDLLFLLLKSIIMIFLASLFFLFLGFAAFVLLHLCLVGGFLHRLRLRLRHTTQLETLSDRISPRDVKKLPQFRFASAAESGSDTQCVVCLDAFRNGQCCRKLIACGHLFHRRCVDMWLIKVAACPTCRTPVRLNASMLHFQTEENDKQLGTYGTNNALWIS
ncbi:hypothetical protein L6164_014118 [Bauhinia variegata]|uniref:Uncharacterized protein n=1 Tax=Bauhinia variegata TaxID=167791 RepID=A0ACB9NGI8_BAUVA|nr:hypothetical protein L6164_014118 [Bauhinia variegata]